MIETPPTRVRFAPSPTGMLHVGNARTALYNWLFARHTGGSFILRIEDTDVERSEARHETQLIEDLRWLGLSWDEGPADGGERGAYGPYRQSDRLAIYAEHTARLLAERKAYRCFCTVEQLEADRAHALATHAPQNYRGRCRGIDPAESARRAEAGEPFAVRLAIPDRPLRFTDIVRGEVEFAADTVSDPVIVRSGTAGQAGVPVYNYVVTIDDALMQITHVIRGDDHISNTPRQVAVYEAFGWAVPKFAHLSTILGADRERLSKRHGATSVASFREMGILPEALVNYLALLGWGAEGGTRETFSIHELTREFKLERVTASPAVFDWDKLHWLNRHYLKLAEPSRLVDLAWPMLAADALVPAAADPAIAEWLASLIALFLPSLDQLDQLPAKARAILLPDIAAARAEHAQILAADSATRVLTAFAARIAGVEPLTAEYFKALMNEVKAETGIKGKDLFHPVRVALTGSHSGPEFDRLIPVIEQGSRLPLPTHVSGVAERVQAFLA
jgi:nondiscriminating glutamyl-tRNA synthetase